MADRRRLITLSAGGRPILDLDLEVTSTYQAIRDTFAYQPGAQNQQGSREPGRFGGQVIVGEANDNGTVSWQALVQGATPDVVASNIEALLAAANRSTRNRLLEWRADGTTYSSYFRVAGPAGWKPLYKWAEFSGVPAMVVEVTVPVRPLVLWDAMTIADPFDVDSEADYTFDAGTAADVAVVGGALTPVVGAALTVERGGRHTARGYSLLEGQATVKSTPVTTITGYKLAARLRASASNTYVEVYVDDNGTNSRLRIDTVIAGARLNKVTTNLAARLITATPAWVRGRIEGNVVVAEYFTSAPTPMGAPTLTNTYTLVGGDAPLNTTAGKAGWSWIPQNASATLDDFEFQPFTYRNQALPQLLQPTDAIPGTAPALVDVVVTHSGGTDNPFWAMIGWGAIPSSGSVSVPAILEAEAATLSGGWATSAQAGARGGTDVRITVAGFAQVTASWSLTGARAEVDEFADGTVDVEVWARVLLTSTLDTVSLVAYAGFVTVQVAIDVPSNRRLIKPTTGTAYRMVRLGVIPMDALAQGLASVQVRGTVLGGSGAFGIDYVMLVLARRRAAKMTGVDFGIETPFLPLVTTEHRKRVRSDLSATVEAMSTAGTVERALGLGGALIQPSPGRNAWLVKLSSIIPDDTTTSAETLSRPSEQLSHAATVSLDVVPRSYMLRSA